MTKTITLLCFLFLCSCQTEEDQIAEFYKGEKIFKDQDFEVTYPKLIPISYKIPDSTKVNALDFIGNYFVIMTNSYNVFIVNTQTQDIECFDNSILRLISGKLIIHQDLSSFMIYDLTTNLLHHFKLDKKSGKWRYTHNSLLPDSLHGLMAIDSFSTKSFITTSINNINAVAINFLADSPYTVKNYYGHIPNVKRQNQFITGMEFRSTLCYNSYVHYIYSANFYTDILQAYDTSGNVIFKLHGPDNFTPIYKKGRVGKFEVFLNIKETKAAYLSLCSDENYIYALYANPTKDKRNPGRTIYIFTLLGKPYKKINLRQSINDLKLDKRYNRLYGYNDGKNTLYPNIFFIDLKSI